MKYVKEFMIIYEVILININTIIQPIIIETFILKASLSV